MNKSLLNPEEGDKDREYKFMIFENFQLDCVRDNKEYMNLFCDSPYTFCVLLNPRVVDERRLEVITRIVENEKPAHTVGQVMLLQPSFYLGMHTYLGINTQLNEHAFIAGKSGLSRDTAIGTVKESGQIGPCTTRADTVPPTLDQNR